MAKSSNGRSDGFQKDGFDDLKVECRAHVDGVDDNHARDDAVENCVHQSTALNHHNLNFRHIKFWRLGSIVLISETHFLRMNLCPPKQR